MVQQQQQFAVLELWQLLLLELWPTFVPSTGSAAITNTLTISITKHGPKAQSEKKNSGVRRAEARGCSLL